MRLRYKKLGQGRRKVIALHGWLGDERAFDPMLSALTPTEFSYLMPAYRGYGASKNIRGAYSLEEISADVRALASDLGWQRFSLVGHSMGGMVAQRILLDAPDRIERIVAVAPVPASGVRFDRDTMTLFEGASTSLSKCRDIINFGTGNRLSPAWTDRMARAALESTRPEAMRSYLSVWTGSDFSHEISGNGIPIKIIVGEYDPAQTEELMRNTYLPWYPNAEFQLLKNAGHCPIDELPVLLATSIESFLRK